MPTKKKGTGEEQPQPGKKKVVEEPSAKAMKAQRKAERQAMEAARKLEVEKMMNMDLTDDEEEVEAPKKPTLVDRFGNTVTKADLKQQEQREKKTKKAEPQAPVVEEDDAGKLAALKAKAENGGKLSNKERKLLKKMDEKVQRMAHEPHPDDDDLKQFSLSVRDQQQQKDDDDSRAKEIIVGGVSLSAPAKPLLVDADLKFVCGRRYGFIAPNGSGKTVLLKHLVSKRLNHSLDALLVDQEATNIGEANQLTVLDHVLDADVAVAALRKEADECEQKENFDVEHLAAVYDQLESAGADKAEGRARSILSGLGFDDDAVDGPVARLSGGWRVRANLARALFLQPTFLAMDEPSNHLDLDAVLWLTEYLTSSNFRQDCLLIVASHDQDLLTDVCTDHVLLDNCKLEYHRGGLAKLRAVRSSRREKALRDFQLQQKTIADERKKHPNATMDKILDRVKQRLHVPMLMPERPRDYAVSLDFESPPDNEDGAGVSLRGVAFQYPESSNSGGVAQFGGFRDLDFDVTMKTRGTVVGKNGTGKSSLLKLLAGALEPTSGERCVTRRCRVGFYDQHFSELSLEEKGASTGTQFLMDRFNIPHQEARARLGRVGLDSARHLVPLRDLSGGQKARVVFASLALKKPHVLLLDEPTNHLDIESVDALIDGLQRYKGGVLAVTHDAALVDALSRDDLDVEQPLFICYKDNVSSKVAVEPGGFKAYRRRLQREQLMRQEDLNKLALTRLALRKTKLGGRASHKSSPPDTVPPPPPPPASDTTSALDPPPPANNSPREKEKVASLFHNKKTKKKH